MSSWTWQARVQVSTEAWDASRREASHAGVGRWDAHVENDLSGGIYSGKGPGRESLQARVRRLKCWWKKPHGGCQVTCSGAEQSATPTQYLSAPKQTGHMAAP
eukprot:973918-Pleurochrysis_carterae.AAC.6